MLITWYASSRNSPFPPPTTNRTHILTLPTDLLRHLHALLVPLPLHTDHNRRSRLHRPTSTTNDRPALRRQLHRDNPRLLVGRPFQRARPAQRSVRHNRGGRIPRLRPPPTPSLRRPLRQPNRRSRGVVQLHSPSARLAERELILNSRGRVGDRTEYLVRGAGADCGCLDLQSGREGEGVSDWALDELWVVVWCRGGLFGVVGLL